MTSACPLGHRPFPICLAALLAGASLLAAGAPTQVQIQVDPQTVVSHIAPDFLGLGYETSAVAQTNYFSARNIPLIHLYRDLTPHGLIRIGGNISDHTKYQPDATPEVHPEEGVTIINHDRLVELGEFARATGWKVMWGLPPPVPWWCACRIDLLPQCPRNPCRKFLLQDAAAVLLGSR